MLIHPLIDQLKQLKLNAMSEMLSAQLQDDSIQSLSFEERLGLLIDRQITANKNQQLKQRLKRACLRFNEACIADINYCNDRQLDRRLIANLATGDWLSKQQNIAITGACGTGKSWIACALANKACLLGFKAQYWRMPKLLEEIALSRVDGRYLNFIKRLSKINVLIFDDWCMSKLSGTCQQDLLEILDDRYQKHSTVVTSQIPISHWHERIDDPTFADAILDRLLGESHKLELKGPSLRRRSIQGIKIEQEKDAGKTVQNVINGKK